MNELPRSVRDAMARQNAAGPHPDADLLTAFSEGSATPQERQSILAHLASCSACREVVSLAAPEAEKQTVLRPEPSTLRRWLWIPALGAVGVVAISAALLFHHPSPAPQPAAQSAGVTTVPAPMAEPETEKQAAATQKAKADEVKRNDAVAEVAPSLGMPMGASKKESRKPAAEPAAEAELAAEKDKLATSETAPSRTAAPAAVIAQDGRVPAKSDASLQGGVVGGVPSPSANVPSERAAAGVMTTNTVTGPYSQNLQNQALQNQTSENRDVQVANASGRSAARDEATMTAMKSEVAVPAAPPVAAMRQRKAPAGSVHGTLAKTEAKPALRTEWRISGEGQLLRSISNGPWTPLLSDVTFNVVSAIAQDVWVGGGAGTLFHSTDNGDHWTRVVIRDKGVPVAAAITGIRFDDIRRGVVQTDGGQTWITSDAGVTWSRLR